MEEEDIQDHGDATGDDRQYLTPDVESLGLNPYVLGLLRQLVGVDLLREQEVFYLPRRGEHRRRPSTVLKSRVSGVTSISSRISSGPGTSQRTVKAKPAAPSTAGSRAGSIARSDQMSRRSTHSTATSVSDNEGSGTEGKGDKRQAKRTKDKSTNPDLKRPIRRSRRLQSDALAYKPPEDSDEDSSAGEAGSKTSKAKKSSRRGVKRARTADDANDRDANEDTNAKRRRTSRHTSVASEQDVTSKTKPS